MFRKKEKPKDATGQFVDQVIDSLGEEGWEVEGPDCILGTFRRVFRHKTGIVIDHWATYSKDMLRFREPEIRTTEAEEKRVNDALCRWVKRQRREVANALIEEFRFRS